MTEVVQVTMEGLEQLLGKFDIITYEVKRKTGRSALRKAAQLVANKVRESADRLNDPKTSEEIKKNVAVRWNNKAFKANGDLGFRVGILGGAKAPGGRWKKTDRRSKTTVADMGELPGKGKANPGGDTYYWRFIEFGTKDIPAHPFMRPALASSVNAATAMFISEFDKGITRAIKRAAKKAASA